MKTAIQELLKLESDLTRMFDSDERVAMALLEHIRNNKKEMLEKEEEVMVDFAYKFGDEPLSEIPKWYDKQFKTKER